MTLESVCQTIRDAIKDDATIKAYVAANFSGKTNISIRIGLNRKNPPTIDTFPLVLIEQVRRSSIGETIKGHGLENDRLMHIAAAVEEGTANESGNVIEYEGHYHADYIMDLIRDRVFAIASWSNSNAYVREVEGEAEEVFHETWESHFFFAIRDYTDF